jgi:hypothetical protein
MNNHPLDLGRITRETLDQLATARQGVGRQLPESEQVASQPPSHLDPEDRELPAQPADDPGLGIPLQQAPERFFDPVEWDELVSGCGGRDAALRLISDEERGLLVWMQREVAQQPTPAGAAARNQQRLAPAGKRMVANFCASLINGDLVATGRQPPSVERVRLPGELWSMLVLNFVNGTARGGGYAITQVHVFDASDRARTEPEIEKRIEVWLDKRREQYGDELKKILLQGARQAFGHECNSRAFDAAYRRVYKRKRGRPHLPPNK